MKRRLLTILHELGLDRCCKPDKIVSRHLAVTCGLEICAAVTHA